jgi:rubrerythrin
MSSTQSNPKDESFAIAKADDQHTNVANLSYGEKYAKNHTYTVTPDSCTCPDFRFRRKDKGEKCKHMKAVEREQERISGPYTGYDKYGNVDHHYWRCERCGAEAIREDALEDCC